MTGVCCGNYCCLLLLRDCHLEKREKKLSGKGN
jgi:hypothetical protein